MAGFAVYYKNADDDPCFVTNCQLSRRGLEFMFADTITDALIFPSCTQAFALTVLASAAMPYIEMLTVLTTLPPTVMLPGQFSNDQQF